MFSEGRKADDQKLTASRTRSQVLSTENMACIPKDTDVSEEVDEPGTGHLTNRKGTLQRP